MSAPLSTKRRLVSGLGNSVLVLLGLGTALAVAELLLRAFPNWVPSEVRVDPPVRRVRANIDQTYELRLSDGDLFHWMPGSIAPLSPDKDRVVARVHMTTDAYGFRNLQPEQSTYGIVALGDSFTRASGVATPWPQALAECSGIDVLNLGEVGAGPQQELAILQHYGLEKGPHWVILAYFEGNDLYDAASYELATPLILARFGGHTLERSIEAWREGGRGNSPVAAAADYRYPIQVTINGTDLELAFLSYYVGWLSASRQTLEASQNYRLATDTIWQMRAISEAAGAQFLWVYVPSKAHVYLPYLNEAETLTRVFADVRTIELDAGVFLQLTSQTATPALTYQHMDVQARLMADFAAERNINYLDLTPTLQAEAGAGAELYYPYDTHWNQQGHDLAAQAICKLISRQG